MGPRRNEHGSDRVGGTAAEKPVRYYGTQLGTAWLGDALEVLPKIPTGSVQAIITSPPFALRRKKRYGNRPENEYVSWFMGFVDEFKRVLKDDGSLVIELGGAWLPGIPARSIYHFELLVELVRESGFFLAEEFFWFNRAKIPSPAQWVTVDRIRVKDAVNVIWWLGKTERPKANNRSVLKPYSDSMKKLVETGTYNRGHRPSGWHVRHQFARDNGGAIPPNLIEVGNNGSRGSYNAFCKKHGYALHPARFPPEVPEFFVKFLTDEGDLVLDPFGGSNVTGAIAEVLKRRWVVCELRDEYLDGSLGRFDRKESRLRLLTGADPTTPLPVHKAEPTARGRNREARPSSSSTKANGVASANGTPARRSAPQTPTAATVKEP